MNALNLIQFENSLVSADAPAAGMSVGAIIGIIIGAVILLIFFFSFFPVGLAISAGASVLCWNPCMNGEPAILEKRVRKSTVLWYRRRKNRGKKGKRGTERENVSVSSNIQAVYTAVNQILRTFAQIIDF